VSADEIAEDPKLAEIRREAAAWAATSDNDIDRAYFLADSASVILALMDGWRKTWCNEALFADRLIDGSDADARDFRAEVATLTAALTEIVEGVQTVNGRCRWCHESTVAPHHTRGCPVEIARNALTPAPSSQEEG